MGLVCPNAECSFLKAHGFSPTYRDGSVRCADCGVALVDSAGGGLASVAAFSAGSAPRRAEAPMRAQLITAALIGAFFLLRLVPLPFVDVELLGGAMPSTLSILAIGLAPFITAALLVEISAALVPRWRALRRPAGRATLDRATLVVGLLAAIVQAAMLLMWARQVGLGGSLLIVEEGALAQLAILGTIVAGSVLCLLLARAIDARGIGSGVSLLVAAPLAAQLISSLAELPTLVREGSLTGGALALGLVLLAGAAAIAALFVRPLSDDGALPQPLAGVLPLVWAAPLAVWHWALAPVAALVLTALVGRLLHWRRAGFQAALPISLLCIASWVGLDLLAQRSAPWGALWVGSVSVVVLVVVVRDLIGELSFSHEHGALARVGAVPSLAAAQRAQARLASLGIAAHVRAAHHRALLHFFGPHLALEVLVPAAHAERALTLMNNGLIDDEPSAPVAAPAAATAASASTAAAPAPPSSPPAAAPPA